MIKVILLTSILSFSQFYLFSQGNSILLNYYNIEHFDDQEDSCMSKDRNQYVTVQYKYMFSPYGKTFGAQGGMLNLGLNTAKFDSGKIIVGPVFDLKFFPGRHRILASDEFLSDFNESFNPLNATALDSANSGVIEDNFNGGILGNSIFNYGLMLSFFPDKFGAFLFEIKTGTTFLQAYSSIYGNTYVNGGDNDRFPFSTRKNWVFEMTLKPYAIFKNSYIDTYESIGFREFLKTIAFSFYYERFNFKSTEFNGTKLSQVVSAEFMSKYGIDHRFGFKIGIAFY